MITAIKESAKAAQPSYPCLKEHHSGVVALFTGPRKGFVICGHSIYKPGHEAVWAEQEFTPFNGSVTLSNE